MNRRLYLYQEDTKTFTEFHRCALEGDAELAVEVAPEDCFDMNIPAKSRCMPLFLASASSSSVFIET